MAKKPYKIEEAKQEKTIIFRVPNFFYALLTRLSQKNKQSINAYSKDKLMEYIYGDPNIKDYPVKLYEEIHELIDRLKNEAKNHDFLTNKFVMTSLAVENELKQLEFSKIDTEEELKSIYKNLLSKINNLEQITGEKETKFNIEDIEEVIKMRKVLEEESIYGEPPEGGDIY